MTELRTDFESALHDYQKGSIDSRELLDRLVTRALSPSPDRVRKALEAARQAVSTFGVVYTAGNRPVRQSWADELLAKIDAALATLNAPSPDRLREALERAQRYIHRQFCGGMGSEGGCNAECQAARAALANAQEGKGRDKVA